MANVIAGITRCAGDSKNEANVLQVHGINLGKSPVFDRNYEITSQGKLAIF